MGKKSKVKNKKKSQTTSKIDSKKNKRKKIKDKSKSEEPKKILVDNQKMSNDSYNRNDNNINENNINDNNINNNKTNENTNSTTNNNELKISLYSENKPRYEFYKYPVRNIIPKDVWGHSLDINQQLGCIYSNVPLLEGFYFAHTHHYPIRIKPDDIWLLIVQAFSNHVNANAEKLRKYFVNFSGKQKLIVQYLGKNFFENENKYFKKFSEDIKKEMEKFLGTEILDILSSDFSTSNYDSQVICNLSIMGAFKKYFDYEMDIAGCGIPYLILEGTSEDYKKIITKAKKLKNYEFAWYIDKIIPHVEKMVDAKEGKIDIDYFKNMIQKDQITVMKKGSSRFRLRETKVDIIDIICGWILNFFAYLNEDGKIMPFKENSIKVEDFKYLANQMLIVPFHVKIEIPPEEKDMKYKVGFVGCDINENKEIYPVQGWIISPSTQEERDSIL